MIAGLREDVFIDGIALAKQRRRFDHQAEFIALAVHRERRKDRKEPPPVSWFAFDPTFMGHSGQYGLELGTADLVVPAQIGLLHLFRQAPG